MAVYVIKNEGGVKIDTGTSGNGLILPVVPSSTILTGAGETGSLFYSEAEGRIYAYGASGWSPNIGQTGADGSSGTSGISGTSGVNGATGEGLIAGGASGYVLAKASAADYDTTWVEMSGGGGGTTPTYFTYSGSHLYTTSWQSVNIPTGTVTVDSTKNFRVDFWGFEYYPDDFYGKVYTNNGAYGQPAMIWSNAWDSTKKVFSLGTANILSGQLYEIRINYSGSGNQLQFQWKASQTMAMPWTIGVNATLTYL